jgi:hypothetical protein
MGIHHIWWLMIASQKGACQEVGAYFHSKLRKQLRRGTCLLLIGDSSEWEHIKLHDMHFLW